MSPPNSAVDLEALMRSALAADERLSGLWSCRDLARFRPGQAPVTVLDRRDVRIAIVARRSYGKTTVLNALIGRPLLFAHWMQATSFPTYLQSGPADHAEVRFSDGRAERIEVNPEAIAAACAQFAKGRRVNPRTFGAERLTLGLAGWRLAQDLSLIDLAGFDDSYVTCRAPEAAAAAGLELEDPDRSPLQPRLSSAAPELDPKEGERLREDALGDADGVIMVLRPQRFLGEMERAMLADVFAAKGPKGVIPVFNIQVDADEDLSDEAVVADAGRAFAAASVRDAETRYADFLTTLGVSPRAACAPICVAALPALERPHLGDFGLSALQRALFELSRGPRSLAVTSRMYAAGRVLQSSENELLRLALSRRDHEAAVTGNEAITAQNLEAAKRWRKLMKQEARAIIGEVITRFRTQGAAAVRAWEQAPGEFWETSQSLNAALDKAAQKAVAGTIEMKLDEYHRRFDGDEAEVDPLLFQSLRRILSPRRHGVARHAPDVNFLDRIFGNPDAIVARSRAAFQNDLAWELEATEEDFQENLKALRDALEAYVPAPRSTALLEVGDAVDVPYSEFAGALEQLRSALGTQHEDFTGGRLSAWPPERAHERPDHPAPAA